MKCPKCGNEIEEGKLLCEKCGAEVNIVPDFDIELEAQLSESITSMVEELTAQPQDDIYGDDFDEDDDIKVELSDYLPQGLLRLQQKTRIFLLVVFVILVIGISAISMIMSNHDKKTDTYEYQYDMAVSSAAEGNYTDAVDHMERALAFNSENLDARFLLAEYYDQNGQRQSSLSMLRELLETGKEYERRDEVYDMLLTEYEELEEYKIMGELLSSCDIPKITSKYNKYAALEPQFNKLGGTYDELISVTLSGNTQGFVYYTLDGSAPTSNSMVYETPILLESGDYTIKAMFVNMYGVSSDVVTQDYYISLSAPDAPKVNLDSGEYSEPSLIEVYYDSSMKVYYTTDGTKPTKDSIRYDGPIEMPYGVSNFSFIAIDESGLGSETVNRTYQLYVNANFTIDLATQVLMNNLWAQGKISDLEGHISNRLGLNRYRVQTVAYIGEKMYYIFYEEYVDTTGKAHDTNNIFAVDTGTADLYRVYKVNEGEYSLSDFDDSFKPNAG